jgi:hypothetical protein
MTDNEWPLRKTKDVDDRFKATFSEDADKEKKRFKYIGIKNGNRTEFFMTESRGLGTKGYRIDVAENALPGMNTGDKVRFFEAKERDYRLFRLLHDKLQRLTLLGLILAVVGALIDASLSIGESNPIILITQQQKTALMFISLGCTVIGLMLVFWKGILKDE